MTMKSLYRETLNSLDSWYAIVGLVISAISICNAIYQLFDLSLGTLVVNLIDHFRSIFHFPLNLILQWLDFRMPTVVKDLLVSYLAFGGVTARTEHRLINAHKLVNAPEGFEHVKAIQESKARFFFYMTWVTVIWPWYVSKSFRTPFVYEFEYNEDIYFPKFFSTRKDADVWITEIKQKAPGWPSLDFLFDARAVFWGQLVALIVTTVALLVISIGSPT